MSLAELKYIEKALTTLDQRQNHLEVLSRLLKMEIQQIVEINDIDYLNVTTRVKGRESLKEKILRNGYYKSINDPKRLIYHLSDLIGIRIECRFEEDEKHIYKMLKKHFNTPSEHGYYNELNPDIRLSISSPQPQKQKNGFKIYRIDGVIMDAEGNIPFELQIKSLVNMFWGEVEHKIIYKNYNYLVGDKLLIEILHSIKNNLALLDKQLLTIYRNVESRESDQVFQKKGLETMLAKMCSDIFSKQIKRSIGMNVNIKKDCQTIMNYTYSKELEGGEEAHGAALVHAISRLNEINARTVEFNRPVTFERQPQFFTPFTEVLGPYFMTVMNEEFHWNLFFKILFEIEPQNNVSDFEKFLGYLEHCFLHAPQLNRYKKQLFVKFEEQTEQILEELMPPLAQALIAVDHVEVVYDFNIHKITSIVGEYYKKLIQEVTDFEDYETKKEKLLADFKQTVIEILD